MQFSLEYGILKMYTNKYELLNERIVGLQQRAKNTDAACSQYRLEANAFIAQARFLCKTVDITAYGQLCDKNFYRERILSNDT